jgi:hypothetical protein
VEWKWVGMTSPNTNIDEQNIVITRSSGRDALTVYDYINIGLENISPTTANKLSEAISALVEYTTSTESKIDYHYLDEVLQKKIEEARQSYHDEK